MPYRGFESRSLRHLPNVVKSPQRFGSSKNASIRAVFSLKLRTDLPAPEANFVSLPPLFSKAPDCGKTVRIFKCLILRGY